MNFNEITKVFHGSDKAVTQKWETLNIPLSPWQKGQLNQVDSDSEIGCLLRMWFTVQSKLMEGTYCNATWDTHYCWPPTPKGATARINCSEAFSKSHPEYAPYLKGHAFRMCLENGTWLRGIWTNYTECADSYDEFVEKAITEAEENGFKEKIRYVVFIGSILSLVCLLTAITIFCCFRSIWCDRIILHLHLMAALALRYILLFIITEPFIFNRASNYRDEDWICKSLLILYLYAILSSVNWMFIQGIYINGKLTTNVFDKEPPFKLYYTFGWLVPMPFLGIYAIRMEAVHPVKCWKGYSEMTEIWIVLAPILIDLLVNFGFLLNILRVLLTQTHNGGSHHSTMEFQHFRRAAKATLILTPILGLNNLLFTYNPGGAYHKPFVLLNMFFGSTQGIFVALVYCYLSTDVWKATHQVYRRYQARRTANRARSLQRYIGSTSTSSAVMVGQQIYRYTSETYCNNNESTSFINEAHPSQARSQNINLSTLYEEQETGFINTGIEEDEFFDVSEEHENNPENREKLLKMLNRNPFLPASKQSSVEADYETSELVTPADDIPMLEMFGESK